MPLRTDVRCEITNFPIKSELIGCGGLSHLPHLTSVFRTIDCTRAAPGYKHHVTFHSTLLLKRYATLALSLAGALVPRIAHAQRETFTNTNAWFVFNADVAIDEHWGVLFDASARRSGPIDQAMANFVRGGLAYEVNDNVRVAVGANLSRTYPYGELPVDYPVTERRLWEQAVVSHVIGRLDLSHRYRLEQRFRSGRNDPDVDRIDYWERSGRFRYQMKGTLPLSGDDIEPGEAYLSAANEIFIGFGRNVQYNIFDQNRATFSVGYSMTRNWRAEAAFLEQVIFKANGTDVERNHTFTFTLAFTRPPSRRQGSRPVGVTPSR